MKVKPVTNSEANTLTEDFKTSLTNKLKEPDAKALIVTMPNCSHCEMLHPILSKVYEDLSTNVTSNILHLENEVFSMLDNITPKIKKAVNGFPTILIINNNNNNNLILPFKEERTYEELLKFFNRHLNTTTNGSARKGGSTHKKKTRRVKKGASKKVKKGFKKKAKRNRSRSRSRSRR
jgi:thiol-disulfide isomerase/thioredoxin